MSNIICLGIESTAHTFGISIVDSSGKMYSNEKDLFTTDSEGMIPFEVAEHHIEICDIVLKKALKLANLKLKDINLISVSQGPGIGHMLRIGLFFAKSLALLLKVPLVGVNHCIAHLEIGNMVYKINDPVLLYCSGANTQVIAYDGGKYRIFGETLDIGVGNMLDTFARHIGLGFPGGPKIYELSLKSNNFIKLPYVVKGMDISLGGILTNLKQKYDSCEYSVEDLSYSLQETVFAMLIEVSERALAHTGKKELILGGGVACNKRLQEMAKLMCESRNVKLYILENQYLVDNAAMIAWCGIIQFQSGIHNDIKTMEQFPYWRTDDVAVSWK